MTIQTTIHDLKDRAGGRISQQTQLPGPLMRLIFALTAILSLSACGVPLIPFI